jgi:agmatinase
MTSLNDLKKDTKKLLVPAGQGVFTVNTAKEHKEKLQKSLYGTNTDVKTIWKKNIDVIEENNKTCLLGICADTGGGIQRGANWGPLFIRDQIYNKSPQDNLKTIFDLGDIKVIPHLLHDKYLNDKTILNCQKSIYNGKFKEEYPVSPLSIAEHFLDSYYNNFDKRPLFALGGDHSVSYPLVKTYLKAKKKAGIKTAIIHFDAHTDLLTERLGIDLCFGSWCTHILEYLDSPDLLIQLGIRSSGKPKSHWEDTFGVRQYWAKELDTKEIGEITNQIIQDLKDKEVQELYVSFDIDALDSSIASATGTPEPGGLTTDQCAFILTTILDHFPLSGADLVEVAPFVSDTQNQEKINPEPESTLLAAGALSNLLIEHLNKYACS